MLDFCLFVIESRKPFSADYYTEIKLADIPRSTVRPTAKSSLHRLTLITTTSKKLFLTEVLTAYINGVWAISNI